MSNDAGTKEVGDRSEPIPNAPNRWWTLGWKVGVAAAAVVAGLISLRGSGTTSRSGPGATAPVPVVAVKIAREDLSRDQTFEAEFRPYQEIEIYAKVSGFVDSLTVDVGDVVSAGQLLATLEIPELRDDLKHASAVEQRSQAEVKRARATYEDAHLAFSRLQAVYRATPTLVAQQDIDQAESRDRGAEAGLAAAREQVEVAQADIKKLETMLGYSRIVAPFTGVITKRYTDPGALIHAGTSGSAPLLRLSENDRLRLVFPVSVSYVSHIGVGDPVAVRIPSLGTNFSGRISRFTRKVETSTRTMDVEVDVPNPDLKLIPGIYASVDLKVENRKNALSVPVEAVSRQKIPTVFVINKDSQVEERVVKLGVETSTKLEVLSGLVEDDLVMIGNRSQVRPGQKVQARVIEPEKVL